MSGCDLFSTRNSEDPNPGNNVIFLQPDRPTVVIQNLQNAIGGMSTQNYLQCLSSTDYVYNPTQQSLAESPFIWMGWSKSEEQTYFTNLSTDASNFTGHKLQLSQEAFEIISEEKQQFTASYTLTVIHSRSTQGVPTVYQGGIVIEITSDEGGLWYITRWSDFQQGGEVTWSALRSTFVKG